MILVKKMFLSKVLRLLFVTRRAFHITYLETDNIKVLSNAVSVTD